MRVQMKRTVAGSPDGLTVIQYMGGNVYDVPEELAKRLLDAGLASLEQEVAEAPSPAEETKSAGPAPENKEEGPKKRGRKSFKEMMKEKLANSENSDEKEDEGNSDEEEEG